MRSDDSGSNGSAPSNGAQLQGIARLYHAGLNTMRGLKFAARSEAALRQELAVFAMAVPVGLFVAPSTAWYVAMIGALLAVMAVELLNTAVEKLADHVTPEFHPKIGVVKDLGSAAVFCALSIAGLIWLAAAAERFDVVDRARAAVGA
ncbi:diacylglycerol kinase [Terrihabitans sp. B22-R8]|uniref:diacylglycerol kinase n=1 Tax=Terrihabitans sp. B22-R8 TaxID=3425128 RepID=UPI00403C42DA